MHRKYRTLQISKLNIRMEGKHRSSTLVWGKEETEISLLAIIVKGKGGDRVCLLQKKLQNCCCGHEVLRIEEKQDLRVKVLKWTQTLSKHKCKICPYLPTFIIIIQHSGWTLHKNKQSTSDLKRLSPQIKPTQYLQEMGMGTEIHNFTGHENLWFYDSLWNLHFTYPLLISFYSTGNNCLLPFQVAKLINMIRLN